MIKAIAIDLIGLLELEKEIELTMDEDKLERLLWPNKSYEEFLEIAQNKVGKDKLILEMAEKNY